MDATTIPLFGDGSQEAGQRAHGRRLPRATPAPTANDRLLGAAEAAAVLGIGRSKLYELMARGAIRSVKVDRCRRFRQSDLDRFISSLPAAAD